MKEITKENILDELNKFYLESGKDRDIEYTYGFFDSMGRILEILYGKA